MGHDPDKDLIHGLMQRGCVMKAITCSISLMLLCNLGSAATTDQPNEALPKQVKVEPGKVTLFADYAGKWPIGSIPVYLINASTNDVDLMAMSSNVNLKLEAMDAKCKWVRAQPHEFSHCVAGLCDRRIRPGHFITIEGYQPEKGEKQRIRFSLYGQQIALSSNAGDGTASARDIDLAWRDGGAVLWGSFEFVSKVALGEIQMETVEDRQEAAIRMLGHSKRFDPSASRQVLLEVLKRFPKCKYYVDEALRLENARAVADGPFEFVTKVALGEIQLDHMEDLQALGIRVLGESERFDPSASRQALVEVLKRFPMRKYQVVVAFGQVNARAKLNRVGNPAR